MTNRTETNDKNQWLAQLIQSLSEQDQRTLLAALRKAQQ